jgi:glycosyltransferase involved in cell wall biosynthesis
VLSSGGELEASFLDRHIVCYRFPIRTKNEIHPKLFLALPGILALVRKEKFDVLHAHTRVTQVLAAMVSKITGIPYVGTAHGFFKPNGARRLFPCWGDAVIAVSPLVAAELEKVHHVEKNKIYLVTNAVDQEDIRARLLKVRRDLVRRTYGIPDTAVVVGSIARLVEDKGHAFLVEAVRRIRRDFPDIYLLIVGDGRQKKSLEGLIRRDAISSYVKIVPGSNNITELLAVMDIFAHPATFREGFGLSMAEAMIAKKPVIVTDIPAVNSIIENNVTGLVVPAKDSEALAKAILFLARNSEEARLIAARGYEMTSKLCRLERMAEETEAVYRRVLGARKA